MSTAKSSTPKLSVPDRLKALEESMSVASANHLDLKGSVEVCNLNLEKIDTKIEKMLDLMEETHNRTTALES